MNGQNISETIEDKVAWWLLYNEAEPTEFTRFIGEAPETRVHRADIAAQIHRLIEEAKIAGFGPQLIVLFEQLR